MLFIFLILIFLIVLLVIYVYFDYIELFRYWRIKKEENIGKYDEKYSYKTKIPLTVISLTTTPSRIVKLKPTLISLFDQSRAVEKIIINVPCHSLKGEEYVIPNWLTNLKNVYIHRCEIDYGPATKLLPTLLLNISPKTRIIVVDDDVIYGSSMVENFVKAYEEKKCAITTFGNTFDLPEEWPTFLRINRRAKYVDMVMGHNGFLVTSEMFSPSVFYPTSECQWVDDVWFSGSLLQNEIPIYSLGFTHHNIPISREVDPSSLSSNQNSDNTNNRICINQFLNS